MRLPHTLMAHSLAVNKLSRLMGGRCTHYKLSTREVFDFEVSLVECSSGRAYVQ
jgi:hypothetical protein